MSLGVELAKNQEEQKALLAKARAARGALMAACRVEAAEDLAELDEVELAACTARLATMKWLMRNLRKDYAKLAELRNAAAE